MHIFKINPENPRELPNRNLLVLCQGHGPRISLRHDVKPWTCCIIIPPVLSIIDSNPCHVVYALLIFLRR